MAEKQKHEIDKPINDTVAEEKRQENLSRQFKKLKHYLTYLNMEHDEMFDVFKHAKETFISKMFAYCSENKLTPLNCTPIIGASALLPIRVPTTAGAFEYPNAE